MNKPNTPFIAMITKCYCEYDKSSTVEYVGFQSQEAGEQWAAKYIKDLVADTLDSGWYVEAARILGDEGMFRDRFKTIHVYVRANRP